MAVPTDPMAIANEHQRHIIKLLAEIIANQGGIRQLLVGRTCTSKLRDGEWRITKVRTIGASAGIEIFGTQGKLKPRIIGRALSDIVLASNKDASRKEQAGNEQPKQPV